MRCEWKHNPPGITTTEQAKEAMFNLKQLRELERGIDSRYGDKILKLSHQRDAEKMLEFDNVSDPVPFSEYEIKLRERITEFAANRMEVKTLKVDDAGQIAVRTNPDKIDVEGGKERLSEVQDVLADKLVQLLRSTSLLDLIPDDERKKFGKDELAKAKATPLLGLFRLKVEADTDNIKAKLKSGELKPTDLPTLGYQWTQGEIRVDIKVE